MAVAKFNWHGTNPNKSFQTEYPPKSYFPQMCKLNATKEETEAAYNALANHGKVSDFKVKVWNDICAKAYDLCQEWDIHGNEIKVEVWSPFMHVDDRAAWIALAQKTWGWSEWEAEEWTDNNLYPNWKPGVFQAEYYNVLYGSWLLPVGLQKFQVRKGQPVKGEYILRLVEIINHWTELSPMDVRVILVFRSAEQNSTVLLPSCPVNPDCLEMYFTLRDGTRLDDSIQFHITLDLNMLMEKMSITELTSCPLSSLINFMRMDIRCKIWDKVPIYISIDFGALYEGTVSPVMLTAVHVKALWESILNAVCTGDTAQALNGFRVLLSAAMADHVSPRLSDALGFSFSTHHGNYRGTARVRTKRPLPFSVLSRHQWNGSVLVEHQGTLLLFMEDGVVSFAESTDLSNDPAVIGQQNGQIGIKRENADTSVLANVNLISNGGEIVYHAPDIEGRVAAAVQEAHRDRFRMDSSQTIEKAPATSISAADTLHGMQGGAEMSFANELSFVMRDGAVALREDDIQLDFRETATLDIQDTYDTEETITLGEAPPFEIGESENEVRTLEAAQLERDCVVEAAADAVIQSLQSGEVSFGLNANLETEIVAARITAAAVMERNRQATMGAEVEVSTLESAIAERVLRKLMESGVSTKTQVQASLILSLIRFAESTENIVRISAQSDALSRLPKKLQVKTQYITAETDAFIDASYIRGDSLLADAMIQIATDVMPETINSGTYLISLVIVQILTETALGKIPSTPVEGNALAATGSEAGVVLARSTLILASVHEEKLVIEEEELYAADFERTLTIE